MTGFHTSGPALAGARGPRIEAAEAQRPVRWVEILVVNEGYLSRASRVPPGANPPRLKQAADTVDERGSEEDLERDADRADDQPDDGDGEVLE